MAKYFYIRNAEKEMGQMHVVFVSKGDHKIVSRITETNVAYYWEETKLSLIRNVMCDIISYIDF